MTYRSRLAGAFLICTLVPLGILGYVVLRETRVRAAGQYDNQVKALSATVRDAFVHENEFIDAALAGLVSVANSDNRLRAALLGAEGERLYLIDYAGDAMQRAGLDALQLQDATGVIVSSGHFRNDFGSHDQTPDRLAEVLDATGSSIVFARIRTPESPSLAVIRGTTFAVAGREFSLTGGRRIDAPFLSRLSPDPNLSVHVSGVDDDLVEGLASDTDASTGGSSSSGYEFAVGYINAGGNGVSSAMVRIVHDASPLDELVSDINRWFLFVMGFATVAALLVSVWLSGLMSRPLVELARKTERIDITRLNESFRTSRTDEVGLLSRRLGDMTSRLRESASAIREAERRATLGDIARQVNHDLRNGLTPIRNVVRHLGELSDTEPAALPAVFAERRRTLESSISYLDELATRYARLSPRSANERCDVGAIVRQVASDLSDTGSVPIQVKAVGGAWVLGDSVVLRRLVENLIRNAFQSGSDDNRVDVSVSVVPAGASDSRDADGVDRVVRLSISDTGAGMSEETRARIFDDFFTTKAEGTGLGLSIVRRIAMDLQGSISVESELGEGSTFTVEFPQCP